MKKIIIPLSITFIIGFLLFVSSFYKLTHDTYTYNVPFSSSVIIYDTDYGFRITTDDASLNDNIDFTTEQYISSDVEKIYIDTYDAVVNIHQNDEITENKITVQNNDISSGIKINYLENEKQLNISQSYIHTIFNITFEVGIRSRNVVDIYLTPETNIKNINAYGSSGQINIDGVNIENNLTVKYSSGKINLNNVNANTIDTSLSSGQINIENTNSTNLMSTASSGRININNLKSNTMNLTVTSGYCNGSNIQSNKINTKASSGKINIDQLNSPIIFSEVTSGSIKISTTMPLDNYTTQFRGTSGYLSLNNETYKDSYTQTNDTHNQLNINVTSGSAKITDTTTN